MQIDDVYKLLHQACLGSHHLVSDIAQAGRRLDHELANLGEGPTEPTLDPISPDGRILRVHLRPYVAQGADPAQLLAALLRTADEFEGSINQLRILWKSVEQMAKHGHLPFSEASLREFVQPLEALDYPAVHHSEAYTAAYRPACRVIAREYLIVPEAGSN
jgi:hypothetical protein